MEARANCIADDISLSESLTSDLTYKGRPWAFDRRKTGELILMQLGGKCVFLCIALKGCGAGCW